MSLRDQNAETLFLGLSQQLGSQFSQEGVSLIQVSPLNDPGANSDDQFERTDSF